MGPSESVQAAVDAANPGDTVRVRGTHREQVLINKDLELVGGRGAVLEYPDDASAFTIAESGPAWEPIVFAYGGFLGPDGEVSGSDTVDVSVSGFGIDGRSVQPDARRKPAVLLRNVGGDGATGRGRRGRGRPPGSPPTRGRGRGATVEDNTIENMGVGAKETFGILAYGDTDVLVRNNEVRNYERGGIGANGDGGDHPSPGVTVVGNEVQGAGEIGEAWGPNGIQVGFGATGEVRDNVVRDNVYSDEEPVASGILVFESDDVVVGNNVVENADIGLSVGSWGWLNASASRTALQINDVSDVEYGALLEAVAEPYGGALTRSDPVVGETDVFRNELEGTDDPTGEIGVGVVVEDNVDNDYSPRAPNNQILVNQIRNFEDEIVDQGTGTRIVPLR